MNLTGTPLYQPSDVGNGVRESTHLDISPVVAQRDLARLAVDVGESIVDMSEMLLGDALRGELASVYTPDVESGQRVEVTERSTDQLTCSTAPLANMIKRVDIGRKRGQDVQNIRQCVSPPSCLLGRRCVS